MRDVSGFRTSDAVWPPASTAGIRIQDMEPVLVDGSAVTAPAATAILLRKTLKMVILMNVSTPVDGRCNNFLCTL